MDLAGSVRMFRKNWNWVSWVRFVMIANLVELSRLYPNGHVWQQIGIEPAQSDWFRKKSEGKDSLWILWNLDRWWRLDPKLTQIPDIDRCKLDWDTKYHINLIYSPCQPSFCGQVLTCKIWEYIGESDKLQESQSHLVLTEQSRAILKNCSIMN